MCDALVNSAPFTTKGTVPPEMKPTAKKTTMKVGSASEETKRERLLPSPPYGLPLSIAARLVKNPPIPITNPLPTISAIRAQLSGMAVRTGMSIANAMGVAKTT